MHLVLGFLASALMASRKRSPQRSPLLELSAPIRTLHLIPGRVRFEIPKLAGSVTRSEQLQQALTKLEGIRGVRVTPTVGTVLIQYDAEALEPELLAAALIRLLDLEHEMEQTPQPAAAKYLSATAAALNRAVFDQTRGLLDLRTALPLSLTAIALYRMMARQGAVLPASASLLWWSYSMLRRGVAPNGRPEAS